MSLRRDLRMYGRFVLGLPAFLRWRLTLDEARAFIRTSLEQREANFLRLLRLGVFGNPRSPYRPLLELAGCELGDIERSMATRGLDATLRQLREAGVYFTFEEYKGRAPVVRGGRVIPVSPEDFDNPHVGRAYEAETGGSTGHAGTRVAFDLETMRAQIPHFLLDRHVNATLGHPQGIWRGTLPDPTGIGIILRAVAYEAVPVRWFTPGSNAARGLDAKNRLAMATIRWGGRLCGVRMPRPEPVPLERAGVIARWAAAVAREHGGCVIGTGVSLSVRVCLAAADDGVDLRGVTFKAGGEPYTAARAAAVRRTGARLVPHYVTVDTGPVALACAHPVEEGHMHLLTDCLALIQHPREVLDTGTTVEPFYFTTLRPTAAKILLNVESDDYGIVERRSCGCEFQDLGYTEHLRQIRSFGKLTGEGVTLVGSDMTRILEEVLPARLGGGPLDFQLLEEQDEQGLTRMTVLVSPRVSIDRDQQVVDVMLEALGNTSVAGEIARAYWHQAGTFRVRRAEPIWTARGKLLPIRRTGRRT